MELEAVLEAQPVYGFARFVEKQIEQLFLALSAGEKIVPVVLDAFAVAFGISVVPAVLGRVNGERLSAYGGGTAVFTRAVYSQHA